MKKLIKNKTKCNLVVLTQHNDFFLVTYVHITSPFRLLIPDSVYKIFHSFIYVFPSFVPPKSLL